MWQLCKDLYKKDENFEIRSNLDFLLVPKQVVNINIMGRNVYEYIKHVSVLFL